METMKATIDVPSEAEVLARFNERAPHDMFGFEANEYLIALPFSMAKEFLKPEATAEEWDAPTPTREHFLAKIKDYMPFAFEKAHGERGISANRSVMHFIAWTWLAGDREFSKEIDDSFASNYHSYGLPILRRICGYYGLEPKEHGDC